MYKTNFVCTYKKFEELADDEVNSDMLYQAQFLQVFGIVEYNDVAISAGLELIKAKMDEVPELKTLVLRHPYSNQTDSLETLLPLMFAYPLMDVFHLCLIDAFKTGSISTECWDNVLRMYETLD
jgi:hypothetical protein